MTRAARMTPDQRRESILDAVLPLVLESGPELSTKEIAAASGIAEGTIFRVFESKSDLLDAAIVRALTPTALVRDLEALARSATPLSLRDLIEAIALRLQEHARSTHRLVGLLTSAQRPNRPDTSHHEKGLVIIDAIEELLAPHAAQLGTPTRTAASAIVALSYGSLLAQPQPDASTVARIALYGISVTDGRPPC